MMVTVTGKMSPAEAEQARATVMRARATKRHVAERLRREDDPDYLTPRRLRKRERQREWVRAKRARDPEYGRREAERHSRWRSDNWLYVSSYQLLRRARQLAAEPRNAREAEYWERVIEERLAEWSSAA
jgi:hypothetical protein